MIVFTLSFIHSLFHLGRYVLRTSAPFSILFFKQKTAYEMRISDWSSDVCSSDLCDQPVVVLLRKPRNEEDYDRLVAALDELLELIGEDEDHPLMRDRKSVV